MIQRIAVFVFEGISPFHLSVPHLVFGEARTGLDLPVFELVYFALAPGRVHTSMGSQIAVTQGLEAMQHADLIIFPSWQQVDQPVAPALLAALQQAHQRGAVVLGLCLGAFIVAEAGLLDGRTATTHWEWAEPFARRFPRVTLDAQVLYIDHGDVITSAGTAAGLDCCLHVLRKQCGAERAARLARRLVIPPHRQGGQAQFVEHPVRPEQHPDRLGQTLEWARSQLTEPLDIDRLAAHAAMSRRTFTRHFAKATGMSVVQWLTVQRVTQAQRLLETTDWPIEQVAQRAGFGSVLSLRQAFSKELNTTPRQYRREFRGEAAVTVEPF